MRGSGWELRRTMKRRSSAKGLNFFHIENWYSAHSVIRTTLKLTGLYRRGRRNAERVRVTHNEVRFKELPHCSTDLRYFTSVTCMWT